MTDVYDVNGFSSKASCESLGCLGIALVIHFKVRAILAVVFNNKIEQLRYKTGCGMHLVIRY